MLVLGLILTELVWSVKQNAETTEGERGERVSEDRKRERVK